MFTIKRSSANPILSPIRDHQFEAAASFNGCPIMVQDRTYLVYRAMSEPRLLKEPQIRISSIGRAISKDGRNFDPDSRIVLVSPDRDFDQYGCEDPKVTKLGSRYFITYTALSKFPFGGDGIHVGLAISKDLRTIQEKHSLTPFNSKGMVIFPEKINGKYASLLTVNTDSPPSDICYAEFDEIEDMWNQDKWKDWRDHLDSHKLSLRRQQDDHLELGSQPIKTDSGWLVIYSHIQKYGHGAVFGVEAFLLDLSNPRKILGRTKGPFLVPEDYYEKTGMVSNIIFPTGALLRGDILEIHYGASDTHCAIATVPLKNFIKSMDPDEKPVVQRFPGNPIISPRADKSFEVNGTLNPAAIEIGGKIHILYRAFSNDNISTFGYANTTDGLSIDERLDEPIYRPRMDFENRGCEDPRLMKINSDIYMTYTAYDGSTPRVAITKINESDFIDRHWDKWSEPKVITPAMIPDKDAVIIPQKINDKYIVLHRINESVCADMLNGLDFETEKIDECIEIISPRKGMWDGGKVGVAAPPIKTEKGWLLFYHGVSWSTTYRVGAVLLDLENPTIVKARTAIPIFEPIEEYERKGVVPNVVFPCGIIERNRIMYMYYGAADKVIGVATMKLGTILRILEI